MFGCGRTREREKFVPLVHPQDHPQAYFGEVMGVMGGVRQRLRFFCMDLP